MRKKQWYETKSGKLICSCCGTDALLMCVDGKYIYLKSKYCPHCGALLESPIKYSIDEEVLKDMLYKHLPPHNNAPGYVCGWQDCLQKLRRELFCLPRIPREVGGNNGQEI